MGENLKSCLQFQLYLPKNVLEDIHRSILQMRDDTYLAVVEYEKHFTVSLNVYGLKDVRMSVNMIAEKLLFLQTMMKNL